MNILAICNAWLLATALMPLAIVDANCIGVCLDAEGQPEQQEEEVGNTTDTLWNPAEEDPEWPGALPPPESLYAVIINIRYDDYPHETSWVLEQLTPTRSVLSADSNSTKQASDEYVVIDSYDGSNENGGALESYQQSLSPKLLFRFSIIDDFDDGICCIYGNGWLTLTDQTGVFWSLYGDTFTDLAEVYFSMDEQGNTNVVVGPDIPDFVGLLAEASSWLPDYTLETLNNTSISPQKDALLWTAQHPDFPGMPTWRKQQLFGLATFFYSTEGSRWLDYSVSECQWVLRESQIGVTIDRCVGGNSFKLLENTEPYELIGSIPPELSLVSSLTQINLSNQYLGPSVPTELFSLPFLAWFWISFNEFAGIGLPTEIGLLTSLTTLNYGHNAFTGSVPTELANLSNLRYVYIDYTLIEGKIPTELCEDLGWINVFCSRVSCPCEECRCSDEL